MQIPTQLLVLLTLSVAASQTLAGCADADAGANVRSGQRSSGLGTPAPDAQVDEGADDPAAPVADAGAQTGDARAAAADEDPEEPSEPDDDGFSCPACGMG
jgi:hypothetical protein